MKNKSKSKLKVINLYGAPGVGKSAVRSGVFWLMKSMGESIEEVNEYAKYLELTDQRARLRTQQMLVLAKQHDKQLILQGKYTYAVTDSPLHLCGYYAGPNYLNNFPSLIAEAYQDFENINFFLTRNVEEGYETMGRSQSMEDSKKDSIGIRQYLIDNSLEFHELGVNMQTPYLIYKKVLEIEKNPKQILIPSEYSA